MKKLYEEEDIRAIAEEIRKKADITTEYAVAQMPNGVHTVYAKGYNNGLSDGVATQPAPSISVSLDGLITATAGNKSATKQLPTQGANTITPSTSTKTAVASGRYTTGEVTVKGDSNLVAANIKKGVTIFGVAGTLDGGDTNTNEIYNDGYNDGWDDGYSDGQSLFLTDFADWDIDVSSGTDVTVILTNKHSSLTLNATVRFIDTKSVDKELVVAPNGYGSVAMSLSTTDFKIEIINMRFSITGG